jgi:hypothetical protein
MRKKMYRVAASALLASGLVLLAMGIGNNLIADETGGSRPCSEKRPNGDCGVSCPAEMPDCDLRRNNECECRTV